MPLAAILYIQASARHVTHKKWIFIILSVPGCEKFDQKNRQADIATALDRLGADLSRAFGDDFPADGRGGRSRWSVSCPYQSCV